MTLTKHFTRILFLSLSALILSCSSSDSYPDGPQFVKVTTAEVDINFDLTDREDWLLYIGNVRYDFTVDGKKLIATPFSDDKAFAFEVTEADKSGLVYFTLVHKDYYKRRTRDVAPIPPNLTNQSMPEAFESCDILRAEYKGEAKHVISASFFHENALLMFNVKDRSAGDKIFIKQIHQQTILPLFVGHEEFRCRTIVFPTNTLDHLILVVERNGKTYEKALSHWEKTRMPEPTPRGLGYSTIVTFNASINEQDNLIIEDLKLSYFNKSWPLEKYAVH